MTRKVKATTQTLFLTFENPKLTVMPFGKTYTLDDFIIGDKVMFEIPHIHNYET